MSISPIPWSIALLGCMLISSTSSAGPPVTPADANEVNPTVPQADIERALNARERPFFVGVSGGLAWATVSHPQMVTESFMAPTLGVHAGTNISPRWAIALELTTIEKSVAKAKPGGLFSAGPAVQPQIRCNPECPTPNGGAGGELLQITALFGTLGPRLELTPFGRDGLFLSGSGGLAFVQGLDARAGIAGAARVGFRARAADIVAFSLELGLQGQAYADASAVCPYGALMLRPYF